MIKKHSGAIKQYSQAILNYLNIVNLTCKEAKTNSGGFILEKWYFTKLSSFSKMKTSWQTTKTEWFLSLFKVSFTRVMFWRLYTSSPSVLTFPKLQNTKIYYNKWNKIKKYNKDKANTLFPYLFLIPPPKITNISTNAFYKLIFFFSKLLHIWCSKAYLQIYWWWIMLPTKFIQ